MSDLTDIFIVPIDKTKTEDVIPDYTAAYIISVIFFIIWVALGIGAFIMSIICFGYSGTTSQQVIGLLLAIFFGPFYWIYYGVVTSYCKKPINNKRR